MEIKILGTGCSKCIKLGELVTKVCKDNSIDADIEKVTDITEIMSYGVMSTPALVIDGEVKCYGKLPSVKEIEDYLL